MRFLLDTVAIFRAVTAPSELPTRVRETLAGDTHQFFVSAASAWELAIKSSLGKLQLPCPIDDFFPQASRDLLAETLGIDLRFVAKVGGLPHHHGDPFDRMIIAQALVDGLTVVTSDVRFAEYGVKVLW